MKKRVLVIGGTNFVGPYILKNLLERGLDITVCTRGRHRNPFEGQTRELVADVNLDADGTRRALAGCDFDVVIDCVSYCPQEVFNVLGNVETGRYIQISTMGVYDYTETPIKEKHFDPNTFDWERILKNGEKNYGLRKRAAEAVAFQVFRNSKPVTIRPAYVTDPNNISHKLNMRFAELAKWVMRGNPISTDCADWKLCLTHVEDEAALITHLVDSDYSGAINVACGDIITIRELVSFVEKISGIEAHYSQDGMISGFIGKTVLDISLFKVLLSEPRKVDEWLWEMMEKVIANGADVDASWGELMSEYDCCK